MSLSIGASSSNLQEWPSGVKTIEFPSSGDGTEQPALFFAPDALEPRPMVVFLHQWGGNYLYRAGIPVAEWCKTNRWIFAQPDFRGPNRRPEAMGSGLALSDIQSVVHYARSRASIDMGRIFLLGASGGGHAALLAAGRLPGLFRGVSAWVPITDLVAWHAQCETSSHQKYSRDIEAACDGPPVRGSRAEAEAINRSPLTHLTKTAGTIFDLNAGLHDGHGAGSVPVSHSFHAYNLLASFGDRIAASDIEIVTKWTEIPEDLRVTDGDESYGARRVLLRKESKGVRITIFDGGHEMALPAALSWLEVMAASD